ncbi:MAG: hypothetical protein HC825_00830, partial [Oscillatoriales cyanobacterium RM1_1_9]|nr:hypothetical protein [Oscillatoriales cyanobacterium RM1_1_9]
MKSPISIRTLLTLPFILQMVGIVGLTGYLSWQNGQKAVRSLVIELQDEVSDRIEQKLASFLSTPELITELNQKAVSSGELDLKNITALQQRGWQQISTFTTISLVQFGTEIGNFVAVERRSENTFATAIKDNTTAGKIQTYGLDQQTGQLNQPLSLTAEKYDPRTRSWYQTVASSQKPQWIKIYAWVEQDVLSLTFVRPLFSQVRQGTSTQTEFVGVTGADLSFEELDQFLERQRLGQNGKMFIIER